MMRSKRHRAMTPIQWVSHNPFLSIAILAGISLAALQLDLGNAGFIEACWRFLGYGFHVVGGFLSRILPDLHGWLELALIAVVGLGLYLLLDVIWRWLRPE